MNGVESIAAERKRQVEVEGWTPEHDDKYTNYELVIAAFNYAMAPMFKREVRSSAITSAGGVFLGKWRWPWDRSWWKPKSDREDLVRAGALIAAEIDRLDRLDVSRSEK